MNLFRGKVRCQFGLYIPIVNWTRCLWFSNWMFLSCQFFHHRAWITWQNARSFWGRRTYEETISRYCINVQWYCFWEKNPQSLSSHTNLRHNIASKSMHLWLTFLKWISKAWPMYLKQETKIFYMILAEVQTQEKESLQNLQHLIHMTCECLGLWKVICDHQFHVVASALTKVSDSVLYCCIWTLNKFKCTWNFFCET